MSCNSCCTRDVTMTLWGGVATLVALASDSWGCNAHIRILWRRLWMVIVIGFLMPISDLVTMIFDVSFTKHLMKALREEDREAAKIIARCVVAVSVSPRTHQRLQAATSYAPLGISNRILLLIMREEPGVDKVVEPARALKFGARADGSEIVLLNTFGKTALLRAGLVPNLENLQLLEAYSPVTVFFSGVQAGGYIIAVLVRLIQDVAVSPVEQMACLLSGIVVLKCILHIFVKTTHHPLALHLNPADQVVFTERCNNLANERNVSTLTKLLGIVLALFTLLLFVLAGGAFNLYNYPGDSLEAKVNADKKNDYPPGYHRVQGVPTLLFLFGLFAQTGIIMAEMLHNRKQLFAADPTDERPIIRTNYPDSYQKRRYWVAGSVFMCSVLVNMLSYLISVIATLTYWIVGGVMRRPRSLLNLFHTLIEGGHHVPATLAMTWVKHFQHERMCIIV